MPARHPLLLRVLQLCSRNVEHGSQEDLEGRLRGVFSGEADFDGTRERGEGARTSGAKAQASGAVGPREAVVCKLEVTQRVGTASIASLEGNGGVSH